MGKIYDLLKRRAAARQPMPTNIEMGELIGGRGRQSIAKALDKLEAQRRIRVDNRRGSRRVYIPSIKEITGWGEHRLGHAPYCLNARGAPPARNVAAPKPVGRGEGFFLLGIYGSDEYSYKHAIFCDSGAVSASNKCQFINNDLENNGKTFCGKRSKPGKSWCDDHYSKVFICK
jgi:hypothetical protein